MINIIHWLRVFMYDSVSVFVPLHFVCMFIIIDVFVCVCVRMSASHGDA